MSSHEILHELRKLTSIKEKGIFIFLLGALAILFLFTVSTYMTTRKEDNLYSELLKARMYMHFPRHALLQVDADEIVVHKPVEFYEEIFKPYDLFFGYKAPEEEALIESSLPPEEQKESFVFQGVVQMGGDLVVVIKEEISKETYFVKQGDLIKDYHIDVISKDKIELINKEETITLILKKEEIKQNEN